MNDGAIRNYRATVAYDGTSYHGFQWQPEQATVQGELTRAAERITRENVSVIGAGRTDAGVHALGQVISFRTGWRHSVEDLERALNAVLPEDIAVREVHEVGKEFHARYGARQRTYVYSVYTGGSRQPLLDRYALHSPAGLDMEAMGIAARHVIGRQDLASLGQSPSGHSTVREVFEARWVAERDAFWLAHSVLRFYVSANGFLRGMVRRLVGSLLEVGRGHWSVTEFAEMVQSRDIARAAPPVPARGLCLLRVDYDG
ncbi:MAG: tRNA pseudouridine(38-40) synthase TruA [Anaerolineae bacterium]